MAAKLRKFVTINKFSAKTEVGDAFNDLRTGINRAGVVTDSIGQNVIAQSTLLKFQADYLSDSRNRQVTIVRKGQKQKTKFFTDMKKRLRKMFGFKKRKKAEEVSELGVKEGAKQADKRFKSIRKPIESFIGMLSKTLGTMVKWFVIYGALNFIQKNPEQVTKLAKFFFTLGKFAFKIATFGMGGVIGGLSNVFGDLSDKNGVEKGMRRFVGVFQLIGGIAALRTAQYLIMPWKLISDIKGVNSMFDKNAMTAEELKKSQEARLKGYRDKKTGVIYSKDEYEAMRKSANRADAKRGAKAGKGYKSELYNKELEGRFQKQYRGKGKLQKLQQRGRIARRKMVKGVKGFAKKNPMKMAKGFAVLGGITRIASGMAMGEEAGSAIGAGVGQAVGGMAGAAALTAVAPFLGPFAPMIGSAIGGFLGEWVGKSFGKLAQPIFEPIKRAFSMYFELAKAIYKPFIDNLGPALGQMFQVIGQLGGLLFSATKPLRDFYLFVFSQGFKAIGETVSFVIKNAKRLMDPGSMAQGFADILTGNIFDFDKMNEPREDKNNKKKAAGGPVFVPFHTMSTSVRDAQFAEGGVVKAFELGMKVAGHNPTQRLQEFQQGGKVLTVPYYNQRANDDDPLGRKGDTQCYSTVMAMWTSYLTSNNVSTKEYNKTRSKYGSSTSASAQQKALKDYGIESKLQTGVEGYDVLKKEIDDGYPVPLGMKYTGSGHWAMLTGYSPLGWIVHDPFGQLGKGGNWIKKNSQSSKTDGVGKSYLMTRDIFQDQSPEDDIWMWKAPRNTKEITKPKSTEPKKAWWDPLGVFTGNKTKLNTETKKESDEVEDSKASKTIASLLDSLSADLEKAVDKIKMDDNVATNMTFSDSALLTKAQKDADEEMQSNFVVITQQVEQPIINNVKGDTPNIRYVSTNNGMLTNGN